jgi:hypothetical protein
LTTDVLALELKRCEEGRVCPAFFVACRSAADGRQHFGQSCSAACALYRDGRLPVNRLLSGKLKLEDINEGLTACTTEAPCGKSSNFQSRHLCRL